MEAEGLRVRFGFQCVGLCLGGSPCPASLAQFWTVHTVDADGEGFVRDAALLQGSGNTRSQQAAPEQPTRPQCVGGDVSDPDGVPVDDALHVRVDDFVIVKVRLGDHSHRFQLEREIEFWGKKRTAHRLFACRIRLHHGRSNKRDVIDKKLAR
jgi:hypothetical protein